MLHPFIRCLLSLKTTPLLLVIAGQILPVRNAFDQDAHGDSSAGLLNALSLPQLPLPDIF
jgi:hypothetical protein